MASLTQVAITTRRVIRYSIYTIILIVIARMLFGVIKTIYLRLFPPPPPAPTVAFGKLPALSFPEKVDLPQITYTLETTNGELPKLNSQAKVYYMPKPSSHLLALDVARDKAAGLGFISEPQTLPNSETIYRFNHPRVPATLEMNIVTGAFSINYDLVSDQILLNKRPPTPEVAAAIVRSFLSKGGLLPKDLTGNVSHEFLKVESGSLTPAISLSEASFIKINLFRKSFDNLPSLPPDPSQANIWFIVSGDAQEERQIIAGEYHYFAIDETQFATYPLKTSQEAFNELSTGKGYVANLGLNKDGKVTIRKVYLAYYDQGSQSEFYQPIFVFEGDRGFSAYVPAVNSTYYGQ